MGQKIQLNNISQKETQLFRQGKMKLYPKAKLRRKTKHVLSRKCIRHSEAEKKCSKIKKIAQR
jgi:hypothetical protein